MRHATAFAKSDLSADLRRLCLPVVAVILLANEVVAAQSDNDRPVSAETPIETNRQAPPSGDNAPSRQGEPTPAEPSFAVRSLRGRVVWMADALARRHHVQTVPEAAQRILALETVTGELFPLVEDVRGRAFRVDPRLRDMHVELLVRQHRGSPMVQVIQVFEISAEDRFEVDYWCEICAIAMFELKPCDCCQAPNELRRRRMPAAK